MGKPAGQIALGLARKASPQEICDYKTEDAIAKEFETFVAALGVGFPVPAAPPLRDERARMGQGLYKKLWADKFVTDGLRKIRRKQANARRGTSGYSGSQMATPRTPRAAPSRRSKRR